MVIGKGLIREIGIVRLRYIAVIQFLTWVERVPSRPQLFKVKIVVLLTIRVNPPLAGQALK
jgi:hypothetical protein